MNCFSDLDCGCFAFCEGCNCARKNRFVIVNRSIEVAVKVKVIPQQAEVAQAVPGRLRPRIFLTFGTTRVVGRQPYAPAVFTPG